MMKGTVHRVERRALLVRASLVPLALLLATAVAILLRAEPAACQSARCGGSCTTNADCASGCYCSDFHAPEQSGTCSGDRW